MKTILLIIALITMSINQVDHNNKEVNLDKYPSTVISNKEIEMKIYLPDSEKGLYRTTRFDWSGLIGSVKYKGHEYFGYWKKTHDPFFHEDLLGPAEGYINPGLGYEEALPGEEFIRIGVGIIEKANEDEYNWMGSYKILDHGNWSIDKGDDWLTFTHKINSKNGYGYNYQKTIRLKNNGFTIEHKLSNTGIKTIETDQFNHNFFRIDGEPTGPAFSIRFPYPVSTRDDLKGYVEIKDNRLNFIKELNDDFVFMELNGYGKDIKDNCFSVVNHKTGAGVNFSIDKPIEKMVLWAITPTICPESFILISVQPGKEEIWTSDYSFFVEK